MGLSGLDCAIESLAAGTNGDPFAILGPHALTGGSGVAIRAFHPAATGAALVIGGAEIAMTRRHPSGVFEAIVDEPSLPLEYEIRVTSGGAVRQARDPYAFAPVFSPYDAHLFGEGKLRDLWKRFGAHRMTIGGVTGFYFAVWAPNAARVSVIGDFNAWDGRVHAMRAIWPGGVWEIFVPSIDGGERYKFEIRTHAGAVLHKIDPIGAHFEVPPQTASVTQAREAFEWGDADWMASRDAAGAALDRPMAIYEAHLGSWRRGGEPGHALLTYEELAATLVPYVKEQGFTHIELLPVMEHPFSGSWGYQVTGFYAPTSRHGAPAGFKHFVDACHRAGLGVILDWVPGHFPKDAHGLARFDGTALYEHEDPRQGEHQDWGTLIFNYGRNEVRNFLVSNALFWLEEFHIDGLRVDAVASMLYLDYSRDAGAWVPNKHGGRENLEAIAFLQELNTAAAEHHPGAAIIAEESTSFPAVSRPVYTGGLGFTYKWNMGWMHDVLTYASKEPVYRKWDHHHLTFSLIYAWSENFILPFSHDEVVHGKRSMLSKMPGDPWQQAATLRLLYGFMYAHPGKKLLFMGCEFGQTREWSVDQSLDWHLLDQPLQAGMQRWTRDLNALYTSEQALFARDFDPSGFAWLDCADSENSVVSLVRSDGDPDSGHEIVVIVNWTPVLREGYRIGVPREGFYQEALNSDGGVYGGSNAGNTGGVATEAVASHGHAQSLLLTLPPLGCLFLKRTDVPG
ncbi:MAG: 1,4-alpha-glucan branching protein GlgB [Acidobacteriota bacterium]|nr:1,4-alpha-glucan branching protein GlgB [Acidobacteriota bacterium]